MYEENENKIDWPTIIKKAAIIIGAILVILGIITMITKCTKKEESKPLVKPVDLTDQLDALESATLAYLTKDNLPIEINASKTIRLKILINQNLVSNIIDSNNNTCDVNESYSEVTRLENNYAVKMSLNCGSNKDYRIIYVGCFEDCSGEICKGTENKTNGVCSLGNESNNNNNNNNNNNENNNSNNSTSTTTKPNTTTTTKKSTQTTTTKKTTTTTTKKPTTTTTKPTTAKQILYEYIQCTSKPVCNVGTLVDGKCQKVEFYTAYGTVVKSGSEKKVEANKHSITVYFNSTQEANKEINSVKNTDLSVTTYTFNGITSKGYSYTKTVRTYKYVGNVTYSCADPTYTYVASTNTCSKMASKVNYYNPVPGPSTCRTIWSPETSILGWLRTGNTK